MLAALSRWWEDKFQLPASHELCAGQTPSELLLSFLESAAIARAQVLKDIGESKGSERRALIKRLEHLNKVLGIDQDVPVVTGDPEMDRAIMEAGEGNEAGRRLGRGRERGQEQELGGDDLSSDLSPSLEGRLLGR